LAYKNIGKCGILIYMKILFITRTFYPGEGDSNYAFRLAKLLKAQGHEVAFFSMNYPKNLPSQYTKYFVNQIDYGQILRNKNPLTAFNVLSHSLYSFESRDKMKRLIADFMPDVVHIMHLGPQMSSSILPVIKKSHIPVVYTLNVYTPLCINYTFINEKTNSICEACKPHKYYQIVLNKCVKASFPASIMGMLFQYFNYLFSFYDYVDRFICPSEFMKNKFIEYGFYPEKLQHLPYFFDSHDIIPRFSGDNYGLFFGRLAPEKGVDILLRALKGTKIPFKIVGDGQSIQMLMSLTNELGLKNVEFLGHKFGDELFNIVSGANFVVVPSTWYEVVGLVSLEAFAYGKPVIGSRMGGIPEVIKDRETGFLFDHNNIEDLRCKIIELYSNQELASQMSRMGRTDVESRYGPAEHYNRLMEIYSSLLN
jgi:glycosyltransferase involved in cell wall biosynthesis